MNHISRAFSAPDGRSYKSQVWESREGGFRRIALVLGYSLWPIEREKKLLSFLMDRGFRVHTLELDFCSPEKKNRKADFHSLRKAVASYAAEIAGSSGLPLYVFASSFSAALAHALKGCAGLAAAAMTAPVLEYPPAGSRLPRFFKPYSELDLGAETLSGMPELLKPVFEGEPRTIRIAKGDFRAAAAEGNAAGIASLGVPTAAFFGEADPLSSAVARELLADGGAKIYSYPRVRHAPAYDRYADNYYADLGSFIDEIEAKRKKKG